MHIYARSSITIASYFVASSPIVFSSSSVRLNQAGLFGLEYIMAAIFPVARCLSSSGPSFSPRKSYMSNESLGMPRMRVWVRCTGNPGSMKSMVSRPSTRCEQRRKVEKLPCMEPTVGIHPNGATSMSRYAFRNLEALVFSLGIPYMLGYSDATPASNASFSASMPTRIGGRPGMPISRWRNSVPL